MEKDLVSIIVPVYNVEKYLVDCIESIITQSYSNLEIVLVDDGSTDKSGKICDDYAKLDKRIKVIHKKNGGLSDARNVGIQNSTGKYITFVDSDDTILNDMIEYLHNLIEKYNVMLSICSYTIVASNGKKISIAHDYKEELLDKVTCLQRLLCEKGFTVSSCAKMYERDLFSNVLFPVGKLCEDNGTTYKLIEQCDKIAYGPDSKYFYYKRTNSIMTSNFNENKLDLIELVDKMVIDLKKEYPDLSQFLLKKQISARFSILRQMINSDYYNSEAANEIISFLLQQRRFIFFSKLIEKREKIAMICLLLGKRFFRFSWQFYEKIKY